MMGGSSTRLVIGVVSAILAAWMVPGRCWAVTHKYPGYSGDNDYVYVGMVNHGTGVKPYACWDGGASHGATWADLGTDSSGLTDNFVIHGDNGASGADWMVVIRSTTMVTGDCAAASSGYWGALVYNGHYLDLEGDGGADNLYGGAGDTWTFGEDGNDYLYGYSSAAYSYGGAGNDNLFGEAGAYDVLYGEEGSDCLKDSSNSWVTFHCGPPADTDWYWSGDTGAGKVNCDSPIDCCGFC